MERSWTTQHFFSLHRVPPMEPVQHSLQIPSTLLTSSISPKHQMLQARTPVLPPILQSRRFHQPFLQFLESQASMILKVIGLPLSIVSIQRKMDEIQNQTSSRLTKPLRRMLRLLGMTKETSNPRHTDLEKTFTRGGLHKRREITSFLEDRIQLVK